MSETVKGKKVLRCRCKHTVKSNDQEIIDQMCMNILRASAHEFMFNSIRPGLFCRVVLFPHLILVKSILRIVVFQK